MMGFEFFYYQKYSFLKFSFCHGQTNIREKNIQGRKDEKDGRHYPEPSSIFIPSEWEILYLNFMSYADMLRLMCFFGS